MRVNLNTKWIKIEYLQGPDLWHMIEAGERDARDVVVIKGTVKKGKQTDGFNQLQYFDRTILESTIICNHNNKRI